MSRRATSTLGIIGLIAAVGLILAGSEYLLGQLTNSVQVNTSGVVASVNLAVYWDQACTQPVSEINWGTIAPGGTVPMIIYIKNIGTVPITLSKSESNWNPAGASSYITLTWNYTSGTKIQPNNVLAVTLTLTVSNSVQGVTSFSFTITITGTESQ
ncbi:MAG: hypothetical protein QXK89_07910 [Candidatus Bathyarchaeia archaeon]